MKNATKTIIALALAAAFPAVASDATKECDAAKAECAESKVTAAAVCDGAKQVTYKVSGDKAGCSASCSALDEALTGLQGVSKASSCAQSQTVQVSYDPGKATTCQITAAIKEAGFALEGQQLTVSVNGMACGACSEKVAKALNQVEGVKSSQTCHESNKAVVLFDTEKVSEEQIVAAINATGFKVAVAEVARSN